MRSHVLSICASLAICTFGAMAQLSSTAPNPRPSPTPVPDPNANPCTASPQTVDTCWRCFQNLLADCDRQNPEGARRAACYTAANNYFTFCLGRTRVSANGDTSLPITSVETPTWDTENGSVYTISTDGTLVFDAVKVYVRYMVDGEPVQLEVQSINIPQKDGTVIISVPASVDVGQNGVVGLVTAFVSNQQVVAARADSVNVVDGFDFDRNGLVDEGDLFVAMDRLSSGQMDKATWNRFLIRYAEGQ